MRGFTTSTTLAKGRQGAAVGVEVALAEEHDPWALDLGLRGKVTEGAGDVALHVGGVHIGKGDPVSGYGMFGVNVLQLGSADGDVSFGMFSPVAEIGMIIWLKRKEGRPDLITLGTRIEYDLRFTSQPNEGFWTVNVGTAIGKAPTP